MKQAGVVHNHINHSCKTIKIVTGYIPTVHFLNDMVFRHNRDINCFSNCGLYALLQLVSVHFYCSTIVPTLA